MADTDFDTGCRILGRRDSIMRRAIKLIGPCRMEIDPNGFRMLVRSIVGQQLSTSAAATIWQRFLALNGGRRVSAKKTLLFGTDQLREVGLSSAKCRAVLGIARSVSEKRLRLSALRRLSDQEVTDELIKLRGVGPWTAQMFLMFSLGRPDVFPVRDLGIVNSVSSLYHLNSPVSEEELLQISVTWRPYRTFASWYLWQALDLVRQGKW